MNFVYVTDSDRILFRSFSDVPIPRYRVTREKEERATLNNLQECMPKGLLGLNVNEVMVGETWRRKITAIPMTPNYGRNER